MYPPTAEHDSKARPNAAIISLDETIGSAALSLAISLIRGVEIATERPHG